jgi:hypothetical protein
VEYIHFKLSPYCVFQIREQGLLAAFFRFVSQRIEHQITIEILLLPKGKASQVVSGL